MHSTHNEEKFVLAEAFIRTLKNKIYKYMTSIFKNVYIDKLADIVNEHKSVDHHTIKLKSIDLKLSANIDFGVENNDKNFETEVGDHMRIPKYKIIFEKNYTPNQP